MIELISPELLARLRELVDVKDPREIIRKPAIPISHFDGAVILECVCFMAAVRWDEQNGVLSLPRVRQHLKGGGIETIDITGQLPPTDEDTIPLPDQPVPVPVGVTSEPKE